jgi:hypothetical protein
MSITERSEILTGLYRVQSELGVVLQRCQHARALQVGVSVQAAQNIVNEAISDFKPDTLPFELPRDIPMPTPKF